MTQRKALLSDGGQADFDELDAADIPALSYAAGTKLYLPNLPSGTLARSYTWASTVESWTTSAGTLTSTGSKLRLTHTAAAHAMEDSGVANVADGEVEVDFTNVANNGSNAVLFRMTDSTHYYAYIFQSGATFAFYKANGGSPSFVSNGHIDFRPGIGVSFHFMVRFVGTQVEAYINGTCHSILLDATFSTGKIGLRADGNGGTNTIDADNMKIYTSPVTTGNVVIG